MGMPDDTSDGNDKLKYTKLLVKSYISIDVDFTINFDSIEQRAENTYICWWMNIVLAISTFHSRTLSFIPLYHPAHCTFLQSNKSNFVIILNLQSLHRMLGNIII